MSDFLWCPECRQSFVDEERVFFAQRCTDCGGLLEAEETGRCEIDYKELDFDYREEEADEDERDKDEEREGEQEQEQGAEDIDETEADADAEGE
ncbi:hypothetical protein LPJ38_01925 [Bradyrhizobium daqingense]|uniref:hypothetical protein n=1 Tax=Bradyrhizobium daqingense TaxID=993502 RepID=UPI00119D143A|nr:hypothetical protein [Bradyrhizobium daqingense]UFS89569.1 hypothetical protein LPJ38_01925 [Bradyrhizobium daqingense]